MQFGCGSLSHNGSQQVVLARSICTITDSNPLQGFLDEASGVEIDRNGLFWAINDQGNSNDIFCFGADGILLKKIKVDDSKNIDWEDLTLDQKDNLYIGNFGNNENDRKNLSIYKIKDFSSIDKKHVKSKKIEFSFQNQKKFPPKETKMHFDVEAFFAYKDSLYLFSKDRSTPFEGITNLYKLPTKKGEYKATFLSTFFTSPYSYEGRITAADISSDGSKVILLAEDVIYYFTDFQFPDIFGGVMEQIPLPVKRQFEGAVFGKDDEIYLVNEIAYGEAVHLMRIDFCK